RLREGPLMAAAGASFGEAVKHRKVLFFCGKGGVGKTTLAAATALALGETRRVLLLGTDPAATLPCVLDVERARAGSSSPAAAPEHEHEERARDRDRRHGAERPRAEAPRAARDVRGGARGARGDAREGARGRVRARPPRRAGGRRGSPARLARRADRPAAGA